jgi:hypothetical protein
MNGEDGIKTRGSGARKGKDDPPEGTDSLGVLVRLLHGTCRRVYAARAMDAGGHRLNITLDAEHAAKLASLAERTHVQEGTLARSLLTIALDDADPEPRNLVSLLDGLGGAFERAQQGVEDARAGRTISLDDL